MFPISLKCATYRMNRVFLPQRVSRKRENVRRDHPESITSSGLARNPTPTMDLTIASGSDVPRSDFHTDFVFGPGRGLEQPKSGLRIDPLTAGRWVEPPPLGPSRNGRVIMAIHPSPKCLRQLSLTTRAKSRFTLLSSLGRATMLLLLDGANVNNNPPSGPVLFSIVFRTCNGSLRFSLPRRPHRASAPQGLPTPSIPKMSPTASGGFAQSTGRLPTSGAHQAADTLFWQFFFARQPSDATGSAFLLRLAALMTHASFFPPR